MSRLHLSLKLFLVYMTVFSLFRGLLYLIYFDEFSSLSLSQVITAFFHGLRFDLALASTFLIIPLLLINLPFKQLDHQKWLTPWTWLSFFILLFLSLLLAADIVYFDFVKRHITQELRLIVHDAFFIITTGFDSYKTEIFIFLVYGLVLSRVFYLVLKRYRPAKALPPLKHISIFIVLFLVLAIAARGGIQRKNIHVVNAYTSGSATQGNLVLNGAYSALRSYKSGTSIERNYFSEKELQQQAKQFGFTGKNPDFPFQVHYPGKKQDKLNIVIVLLESWSAKYIDALTGKNTGVTPNFDRLSKEGLSFHRAYASGQRSIVGIQSVLTSVPDLVDMPVIGWGLENNRFSRLGNILKQQGYHTLFTQSSRRTSFHMDGIAGATGFDHYYGFEDMELVLDYEDPYSAWFGWDHETYNKVHAHLKDVSDPFITFIFTGTTHPPYGTLPKEFYKFPHHKDSEEGFLNTLYYADWALGKFIDEAKQKPWFEDTVFIFTADHTIGHYGKSTTPGKFHIPLVLYSPKHIKAGINNTIASHLDIMPTVIDMLGIDQTFSTIGESLLNKYNDNESFAYIRTGNNAGLITNQGYILHSLKANLEAKVINPVTGKHEPMDENLQQQLDTKLLTLDQSVYQALQANKWSEK